MIHRVFISPDEVYSEPVGTYEKVVDLAAALNRVEALHFLAFLNLLVSSATTETRLTGDLTPVREVQTFVFREIVSAQLLSDLKARVGGASLLDRPVLHRSQLLFAIRLVATHGSAAGGNLLNSRDDFNAIGDLLFWINALFTEPDPPNKAAAALWIATQAGPLYELENPPVIELAWPRIQELLIDRLLGGSGDRAELERLEQVAVFATGFNTQAWLDLSFLFFSYWSEPSFRELMANRGRAYLDPSRPHSVISEQVLRGALQGIGVQFDAVPDLLRIDEFSRATLFDLTPFRTKPIWIMPDGRALCVDTGLLTERLGPHQFWSVINALDTAERRHRFSGAWGEAFEGYALDRLATVFRGKKWDFHANPKDASINEELWDALAVRDGTAIVVEIKGTFVQTAAKYSGVRKSFATGLARKFGMVAHAGAFQLARGISRLWFHGVAQAPFAHPEKIKDVFPVLVVQDPIFGFGGVSRVISDWFLAAVERLHSRAQQRTPTVWPLTVVTADELDRLSAAVEATGARLDSILKRFHRRYPSRIRSISELLDSGDMTDFGFPEQVREIIGARFKRKTGGIFERFRAAEYGGVGGVFEGEAPQS